MLHEFDIGDGGPLHRLEGAVRLTKLRAQVAITLALTWLPLVIIGLGAEQLTGNAEPAIRDASVHVRLLISTPVFLFLDQLFLQSCRFSLEQLVGEGFVRPGEQARFEKLLLRARTMANAKTPELLIAGVVLIVGAAALFGAVPAGGLTIKGPPTAAQTWYALVAWPVFQFLLWRSLWRWAVWARVLIGLSFLDLALVPTHPDRRGGIGFLSMPSVDYCSLLLFAVSSMMSAEWFGGKLTVLTFANLEPFALAYAMLALSVAFGPLLFFSPRLLRARRAGLVETAGVSTALARELRRQAREHGTTEPPKADALAQLVYMTVIHRNTAERLVPILLYKGDLILLLFATFVPAVPMLMLHIPREDWIALVKTLTGG